MTQRVLATKRDTPNFYDNLKKVIATICVAIPVILVFLNYSDRLKVVEVKLETESVDRATNNLRFDKLDSKVETIGLHVNTKLDGLSDEVNIIKGLLQSKKDKN